MTGLRKSIFFMLVFLAGAYNLERLDYSGQNIIDIQSFVYVLILVAILVTITSREFQRRSVYFSLFVWLSSYLLLKVLVFTQRPVLGDVYTYLTITEMSLMAVSVFLAQDLARSLGEFEKIIENVSMPNKGQRVISLREAQEEIKTEFVRSRRHSRPLSVMVVELCAKADALDLQRAVQRIQQHMLKRYLFTSLAQLLSKEARRTDLIIEQEDEDSFLLLCPETTMEGSGVLARRIEQVAQENLGLTVNCGFASFPDEALTFEDLLKKAQFNLMYPNRNTTINMEEMETAPDALETTSQPADTQEGTTYGR